MKLNYKKIPFSSCLSSLQINNMLILPYIEMLVGNAVHTLLLEMENKILSGRTSDHVYKLCHFLFLEIFFALNSVLSAVSSAIPAFSFGGGGEIRFILNDILESFIFIFFGYSFSLCVVCKSDIKYRPGLYF